MCFNFLCHNGISNRVCVYVCVCDVFPKENEETLYRHNFNAVRKSWREFNVKFHPQNATVGENRLLLSHLWLQ